MFKDCTPRELVDIFGAKPERKLPLFVNLWLVREHVRYHTLIEGMSVQYALFATVGLNFFWYYAYLKKRYLGQTLYFSLFPSTLFIFCMYMWGCNKYYSVPKCEADYRININDLLDRDEPFLYENPHFRCLVRRIATNYSHLLNPAYELD